MRLKKFLGSLVVVTILLLTFGAIPSAASGETPREYHELGKGRAEIVPDEIVVKFVNDNQPFRVIKVPEGKVKEKIVEYSHRRDVVYAEPNYYAQAFSLPKDPLYKNQWNFDNSGNDGIGMEEAWDLSAEAGAGVTVAIIDTGIAFENYLNYVKAPDLANTSFVKGYDFVNNDAHANDDNSHGTHVAGTVAQSTNNNVGVAGIAYNATLMPVKVLDKSGSGTYANIALGIIWAADHGAQVINMSLGGPVPSRDLEDALIYANEMGVTIVAAAGNDGTSIVSYPAAYNDYVIAVGATRYDQTLAPYSNYGSSLDFVAPGGDMTVDQNQDGYGDGILQNTFNPTTKKVSSFGYWFFQGTSMASPHVAGIAALLIANGNATNPDEIRAALESSAKDLGTPGRDDTYGCGLVSASAALEWSAVPNAKPVAVPQDMTTSEDSSVSVVLSGSDNDNDPLTYSVVSGPYHGLLVNWTTANAMNYTPDPDYNGSDSFMFRVFDGKLYSEPATVSITVTSVNDLPIANNQTVATQKDTEIPIILTATDVDRDPLTYSIFSYPNNGMLSGTASDLTYTPVAGYIGVDIFTFKVSDIADGVSMATVTISVDEEPVAPTVNISIDMKTATKKTGKNTFIWGIANLSVKDDAGNPIEAATVEGYWTGQRLTATPASQMLMEGSRCFLIKLNSTAPQFPPSPIMSSGF